MTARLAVPVKYRADLAIALLFPAVFASGYATRLFQSERVIVQTRHVHDTIGQAQARAYGEPVQQVDGGQVNEALAGMTCTVYAAALVCK